MRKVEHLQKRRAAISNRRSKAQPKPQSRSAVKAPSLSEWDLLQALWKKMVKRLVSSSPWRLGVTVATRLQQWLRGVVS